MLYVSLQEAIKQVIIEQSVKISTETCTVIAKYPFLKDPVDFLSSKHNGPNNKEQALRVCKGQCRKNEVQRNGMRIVHKELVEKDLMKKLVDCDKETQDWSKMPVFSTTIHGESSWRKILSQLH